MPSRRGVPRRSCSSAHTREASTSSGATTPLRWSTSAGTRCGIGHHALLDDRVVAELERAAARVQPEHEQQPGRLGVHAQADQVGPVVGEDAEQLVDVARPGARAAVARGLVDLPREDVVEHDHARPRQPAARRP